MTDSNFAFLPSDRTSSVPERGTFLDRRILERMRHIDLVRSTIVIIRNKNNAPQALNIQAHRDAMLNSERR